MAYLETRQRLGRPPLCPQTLHDLMLWCWEHLYQFRPSFTEVKEELKSFQTSQQQFNIDSNQNNPNQGSTNEIQSYQRDSGFDQNQPDNDYIASQNLTGTNTDSHQESHQMTMVSNSYYHCAVCNNTAEACTCKNSYVVMH